MTTSPIVGRLEALLARVRSRTGAPRRPQAPMTASSPPVELDDDDVMQALPTRPPPQMTDADIVVDVEVQEATLDTVIGVAEVADGDGVVAEPFESRERLVAAEPVAMDAGESAPDVSAADDATAIAALDRDSPPEVEEIEEAPASSRRPVASQPEEQIADIAFGADEPRPPRHTPPPESGRLPASPVVEFDGDVTGVRDAAQKTPYEPQEQEVETTEPGAVAPGARELQPEVTRAKLVASQSVADVVGEAQRFAPGTFVALLDASLSL